jgi:hypothetical protein
MPMQNDVLVKLKNVLQFDQVLEMAFVCLFMNNPFWFHHVMMKLRVRCQDNEDAFAFWPHPFYDWVHSRREKRSLLSSCIYSAVTLIGSTNYKEWDRTQQRTYPGTWSRRKCCPSVKG